jgi:hypothetical protein
MNHRADEGLEIVGREDLLRNTLSCGQGADRLESPGLFFLCPINLVNLPPAGRQGFVYRVDTV